MRILSYLSITVLSSLILAVLLPNVLLALKVDKDCTTAETIFARGSGQKLEDAEVDAARYFNQIISRVTTEDISHNEYQLGTEAYGGFQYPAIKVNEGSFLNGLGASLSAGYHFSYGESVKKGVGELQIYLKQRHAKCKNSNTRYILGGTSQGAQVIGQALAGIEREIRNDIVFVGFFGDPKLHYPEGEGWNPPACRGKELSPWRKAASNCDLDNGSLVARKPYLPDDMKNKTGLWCYERDPICDPGQIPTATLFGSAHEDYKNEGRAIDEAARLAIEKLQARLRADNPPPTPQPGQPTPPQIYDLLDVQRSFGQGTTGQNVVFMVDISSSMSPYLANIQQFIDQKGAEITARGGQYTVALYYGLAGGFISGPVPPAIVAMNPFNTDPSELYKTDYQPPYVGPYPPPTAAGASLDAINEAFNGLQWKQGATKSLILFTDNVNMQSSDPASATLESVVRKSLAIDPVNVYPVVPEEIKDSYEQLAKDTAGQVTTFAASDLEQAANTAYNKINSRPVPLLKNTHYSAEPNQEITFDASDSYIIDAAITKYEWDFNGDSIFEQTTTTPSINHTYNEPFEGLMQVRVSADNNTVANMSAKVKVADMAQPVLPKAPKSVSHTIVSTSDDKSTVTLQWESDGNPPSKWIIRLNDMIMGHVEGDRTSLDITDLDRTQENVISITGSTEDWQAGEYRSTSVPSLVTEPEEPEPPVTSTCTQSNFFVRLFCQAIALFKTYINGILVYFLPYRI